MNTSTRLGINSVKTLSQYFLFGILSLTLFASCSNYNQIEFEQELMVEAYLINNRPLPDIRLSLTQPVFEFYSFEEAAYSDAAIFIDLIDQNQQILQSFTYSLKEPGIYTPLDKDYRVLAGQQYALRVLSAEGNLRANTKVPEAFISSSPNTNEIVYQDTEQFEIAVTATSTPDRQTSFIFSVSSESSDPANLTPFYASLFEDEDEEANVEEFTLISSPIINEANYELQNDGTILIRLPWISVAFYGQNTIVANSIDDNLFDFVRSQSVQLGGGALAPGEIQNIINRVEGGIGIFGSITSDTSFVNVLPNPAISF